MTRKINRCRQIAAGLALTAGVALGGAAQAVTFTQTDTIAPTDTNPYPTQFDGFSVPGETLTSVVLSWDLQIDFELSALDCDFWQDCEPSIMDWIFSGSSGAFGTATYDEDHWDYGFNNLEPGLQTAADVRTLTGSFSFAPAAFANFFGTGPIGELQNAWASQAYAARDKELLSGAITLAYSSRAVPLPGTLALLGLGLAGIGGIRRGRAVS